MPGGLFQGQELLGRVEGLHGEAGRAQQPAERAENVSVIVDDTDHGLTGYSFSVLRSGMQRVAICRSCDCAV